MEEKEQMKAPLAVMVPTRSRPQNAARLEEAIYNTTRLKTKVFFIVGSEDPAMEEYLNALPAGSVFVFPDRGLVKALNWASSFLKEDYDCLVFMGDDHIPRTAGWDERYVNELYRLGTGMVYGNDLLQGEKIPTQIAMTSDIVDAVGHFGYPGFRHLCVDLAWKDLGEAINSISYMPDVIIEHLHPAAGKANVDDGYAFVNSSDMVAHDTEAYLFWKENVLPCEVYALQGLPRVRENMRLPVLS